MPCMSSVYKVQDIDCNLNSSMTILRTLKENLVMAQNRMKQQVDQGCYERQFVEGTKYFSVYNHTRRLHSNLRGVRN
jgi:hypothetical protein